MRSIRLHRWLQADGTVGELCPEGELLSLMQGTETLEQKVTRLYHMLRQPIYYYLVVFLGNAAEADDITQEVFLRLYTHLHQGKAVENARFWAFRVAHNLAFDERRRHERWDSLDDPSWEEASAVLPDPGLDPEQKALRLERLERLQAALPLLSAQERQCLLLRGEGFRYREIGEILDIGASTVGEFLQRAIRKLRVGS